MEGGDNIKTLINIFFIILSINFFVSIYTIYIFFEVKIFKQEQGSKLKIKKKSIKEIAEEE